MSDRLDEVRKAFEAIEQGDYGPAMALAAPGYKHHIPSRGLEIVGAQQFLDVVVPELQKLGLVQHLETVMESRDFVVATIRATSSALAGEMTIVYVFRYEDEVIAEAWAISPPT